MIKYINYQRSNKTKEYEIIILPGYYTWNLNTCASDSEFADSFKLVYGIDSDTKLNYIYREDAKINVDKLDVSSKLKG